MLNNNTKTVLLHVTVVVTCLLQLQYLIICLDATAVYAELISYIYLNNLTKDRWRFNKNNDKFNKYTIFNKKI